MKLFEIRLYKLKILQNNDVIYEGISEELPDNLKNQEIKNIVLENGEAIVNI